MYCKYIFFKITISIRYTGWTFIQDYTIAALKSPFSLKKKKKKRPAPSQCWKGSRINCSQLHFVQMCHDDSYFFPLKCQFYPSVELFCLGHSFNSFTLYEETRDLRLIRWNLFRLITAYAIHWFLPFYLYWKENKIHK